MEHYVITRFNLWLWPRDKYRHATQTPEWLSKRFQLFEKYCLPSLAAQTDKDFVWLVLFDSKTPKIYRERFAEYNRICPQFEAVPVKREISRDYVAVARSCVIRRATAGRIITTYLDSDDALGTDYVRQVQDIAKNVNDRTFISFVNGMQYYEELNVALRLEYQNNHFISLVEDVADVNQIRTVYGYGSHFYIDKLKNLNRHYDKQSRRMSMETIHDCNVDNDIHLKMRYSLENNPQVLKAYGLEILTSSHSSWIYITRFRLRWLRQFFIRLRNYLFGRNWWE